MNKFSRYCCIFTLAFLMFPSVFGNSKQPEGIYMCTKDVDSSGSSVSNNNSEYNFLKDDNSLLLDGTYMHIKDVDVDKSGSFVSKDNSEYDFLKDDNFLMLDGIEESSNKHQIARHCFMLHARHMETVEELDGTKKLSLVRLDSYGFGKINGETAAYEEMLIGLPSNMAVSCTVLTNENDLTEEEINQNLNVIKEELSEEPLFDNNDNDYDFKQAAISDLMSKKWNAIKRKMNLEKVYPYDLVKHNCCTVAYKSAATLFDGNQTKIEEKVNPKAFNIYGMGVVWGEEESFKVCK